MPPEKTAYLHIGPHKTATTSIQEWLLANRKLLARQGLYVPEAGTCRFKEAHHNIAWEIRKGPRFVPSAGGIADLVHELRDLAPGRILLSSEEFSTSVAGMASLVNPLRRLGYRIVILRAIRHQADLLQSLFNQTAKSFRQKNRFPDYCRKSLPMPRWDYLVTRNQWQALADEVLDIPYRPGFVPHFFSAIGIDTTGGVEVAYTNPSRGPAFTEACRLLGSLMEAFGVDISSLDSRAIHRLLEEACALLAWDKEPFRAFDRTTHQEVLACFQDVNDTYAMTCFGKPWSETFEPAIAEPQTYFAFEDLPREKQLDILELLRHVIRASDLSFNPLCAALPPR